MPIGLPQDASIAAAEATVDRSETILVADPDVACERSSVGDGPIYLYLPLDVKPTVPPAWASTMRWSPLPARASARSC